MTTLETINLDLLKMSPIYNGPHRVSTNQGSGCFMDPPGYPTYYIQPIYTSKGNYPHTGPNQVICDENGNPRVLPEYDYPNGDKFKEFLSEMYNPLPIDHPRVQAWIMQVYGYFNGMWENPEVDTDKRANVSNLTSKPGSIENYRPVTYVRQWYPDHEPLMGQVTRPTGYGKGGPGDWWETESERPTPGNCKPRSMGPHPLNHTWCQWCGWEADKEVP